MSLSVKNLLTATSVAVRNGADILYLRGDGKGQAFLYANHMKIVFGKDATFADTYAHFSDAKKLRKLCEFYRNGEYEVERGDVVVQEMVLDADGRIAVNKQGNIIYQDKTLKGVITRLVFQDGVSTNYHSIKYHPGMMPDGVWQPPKKENACISVKVNEHTLDLLIKTNIRKFGHEFCLWEVKDGKLISWSEARARKAEKDVYGNIIKEARQQTEGSFVFDPKPEVRNGMTKSPIFEARALTRALPGADELHLFEDRLLAVGRTGYAVGWAVEVRPVQVVKPVVNIWQYIR